MSISSDDRKTQIYEQYSQKVLGYIRSKVNNLDVAEDIQSMVFLKVYEKFDSFDESKASISTWIYTIAHNTIIDYYRSNRMTEEVPEDLTSSDSPELEICNNESLESLANALMNLDERERFIVVSHYYKSRKLKDIGEDLQISYAYVKVLHKNALKKLHKCLEGQI